MNSKINPKMNRTKAYKMDKSFWSDFDEETGCHGVFGDVSGFCYATFSDPRDADDKAKKMRETKAKEN